MAFATSSEQPAGTRDDALAAKACVERGLDVISAPWDDPTVRWESFSAVVVRSTWNYSRKIGLFNEWIDRIEASGTRLFNDPDTLRWNADKSYLLELSEAGVPIIPTVRIENSGELDAGEIRRALGTAEVVVKPVVGAGGRRTFRMTLHEAGELDGLREVVAAERLLVQRYIPEILSRGEWSVIYLGGRYSHAIRKTPAEGEFRVHEERGGTLEGRTPPKAVAAVADRALGTLDASFLYARVDLVESGAGPLLMELELIEPALYFEFGLGSPERFADVLATALKREHEE